ncbi:MAG: flavodoxin [Tenericutes bacterium]|nr:flavodoxin [Mycoplasmatota bacterium]
MNKTLVTYFSCSGETKKVAQKINEVVKGDLHEITPEVPYTAEDLNWEDKTSRSTFEMEDLTSRPAITNKLTNMEEYSTIYLGFPIWWYTAPTIINTFLESYDFSNKKIIIFCTSGGSSLDKTFNDLKGKYNYNFIKWNRLSPSISEDEITNFIKII